MPDNNTGPGQSYNPVYLEPRVAKLEVGMERLTDDVRNLAIVVREQGTQVEQEIQKLVVAVTQAAGPRKTEWSTIIAGVMLVLAIGSAAFWPMNQTLQDNKANIQSMQIKIDDHSKIANHPVGEALINRLESRLQVNMDWTAKEHDSLKSHFNDELNELSNFYDSKFTALTEKMNLYNDRLYNRIVELEKRNLSDDERKRDELDRWRHKAMGLTP